MTRRPPRSPLFPSTPLFRSATSRRSGSSGWPSRTRACASATTVSGSRSEEHTSELQSRLHLLFPLFFLNDPAPTEISPLPLHAALPICYVPQIRELGLAAPDPRLRKRDDGVWE